MFLPRTIRASERLEKSPVLNPVELLGKYFGPNFKELSVTIIRTTSGKISRLKKIDSRDFKTLISHG